jgi:5'-nucleotidase
MRLRILVTNDDGILAPGLKVAENIAQQLAGDKGEVITIAPITEQSGVGHSISYLRPNMLEKIDNKRYTLEGSPSDCVLAGLYYIMKDNPPDLIISGVNKGHNIAEDIVYSGTVGAAMEGSLQRIKSLSLSQCYSKKSLEMSQPFEASVEFGKKVCSKLWNEAMWTSNNYQVFYNINFPPIPAKEVQGMEFCNQGKRSSNSTFTMDKIQSPNGKVFLWANHKASNTSEDLGSDIEVINNDKISITPLRANLTANEELDKLKNLI